MGCLGLVIATICFALHASVPASPPHTVVPPEMRCLQEAYPEHICGSKPGALIWCDGTEMPWDDGRAKADHDTLLDEADLHDQMVQRYPLGADYQVPPAVNFEPGRIRHEPFFRKMYGDSAAAVGSSLVTVEWMPRHTRKRLRVTSVNGVDEKLRAVSAELQRLPPKVRQVVESTSGTFNWRVIRGTKRLSMHSFAIAIDVGVPSADYWKWRKPGPDGLLAYRNRIPLEIVEVFEKHGFVWGGKWYHFDTMHFEYRPELLHPACVARGPGMKAGVGSGPSRK